MATVNARRNGSQAHLTGNISFGGVTQQGVDQLISQFFRILVDHVIEIGGTGKVGLLYQPGIGISIDIREYDVSKLPRTRQIRLRKQICAIEDASVSTQDNKVLSVEIKIDMNVIE
jgi:hypothetical protein